MLSTSRHILRFALFCLYIIFGGPYGRQLWRLLWAVKSSQLIIVVLFYHVLHIFWCVLNENKSFLVSKPKCILMFPANFV